MPYYQFLNGSHKRLFPTSSLKRAVAKVYLSIALAYY